MFHVDIREPRGRDLRPQRPQHDGGDVDGNDAGDVGGGGNRELTRPRAEVDHRRIGGDPE